MMTIPVKRIHLLDSSVSNKIAAGEVVERPAAVVKELVENAIDANSNKILVEIESGGKTLIRVTDDGCGITPEDLPLAFMRHATSKVIAVEDLYQLSTLGFRGEALASIAAVSQVTLTTKRAQDDTGSYIDVSGGTVVEQKEIASQQGTSITIRELFFNTPARLKFLRSNAAETASISDLVMRLAISNPQISFKYFVDKRQIWMTPGDGDRFKAIYAVFEKELAKNLTAFEFNDVGIKGSGFISKLNYVRSSRSHQIFFINGRYIRSRTLSDAVASAYTGLLPIGRFPACILYLEVSPELVDVNIHPQKTEVKFDNEYRVRDQLASAIRKALHHELQPPEIKPSNMVEKQSVVTLPLEIKKAEDQSVESKAIVTQVDEEPAAPPTVDRAYSSLSNSAMRNPLPKHFDHKLFENFQAKDFEPVQETPEILEVHDNIKEPVHVQESFMPAVAESLYDHLKYVGQVFSSFLIFERDGKMYWIDQHAAHEKLLYEQIKKDFSNHKVIRQILAKPMILPVDHGTLSRFADAQEDLEHIGFMIEPFGSDSIVVREVPMAFNAPKATEFVEELLLLLTQKKLMAEDLWMERIIKAACKGAIKANDALDQIEVNRLLQDLKKLESPYTCPHGRPIIVAMTRLEIERMFKRT